MAKRIKKPLLLYTGIFNYARQVIKKHSYAPSEKSARARMVHQLAKEHGVHPSVVAEMFNGNRDNFIIEIDPEWRAKHEPAGN